VTNMSMEQILTETAACLPDPFTVLSVLVDGAGKTYTARHALEQISQVSQAPSLALRYSLGACIAGGSLVSSSSLYPAGGADSGLFSEARKPG